MRKFFSSVFFKIVLALMVICIGAFAYTLTFSGISTPVTSLSGIILTPIQSITTGVSNFFSSVFSKNFEYQELVSENIRLKNELRQLEADIRQAEFYANENERLKNLLNIQYEKPNLELEICEVVGKSIGNLTNVLTLDKGSNAGISLYDAVITEDGLLGYVSRVSYNHAQVTTILDPSFEMGSISTKTRELGVSEGSLDLLEDGYLKLSYLDKNTTVSVGDTIETSGVGGLYPKGILIGTVEEITNESNGVTKYAKLKPYVNVDILGQVYIIKSF